MNTSKLKRATAVGLGALAIPVGAAVIGAAPASADPGLCVSGPYGFAHACVEAPNWPGPWHGDGPYWKGHGDGDWGDD